MNKLTAVLCAVSLIIGIGIGMGVGYIDIKTPEGFEVKMASKDRMISYLGNNVAKLSKALDEAKRPK